VSKVTQGKQGNAKQNSNNDTSINSESEFTHCKKSGHIETGKTGTTQQKDKRRPKSTPFAVSEESEHDIMSRA
jgi:hypothetical protein